MAPSRSSSLPERRFSCSCRFVGKRARVRPRPAPEVDPRFAELRSHGDRGLRARLVYDHAWLVGHCVRRFLRRGESRADLEQVAYLGLVKAVDGFDPDQGAAFSSFAVPTILGELRRHFRDTTWPVHVSRRGKELYQAVANVVDDLTAALGRSPTVVEVADQAGLSVEDTLEAFEVRRCYRGVPLDRIPDDGDLAPGTVPVPLGVAEGGYAAVDGEDLVASLIRSLPTARDREVVALRFVHGLTQQEIAARVGVSQVQVSRLLRANLDRMRHQLARSRADATR
jgi:RNA polymerase sigma-B factor